MKITKNINATYNMDTGYWTIRDNGQVLAQGRCIDPYFEALKQVKATATKEINQHVRW